MLIKTKSFPQNKATKKTDQFATNNTMLFELTESQPQTSLNPQFHPCQKSI